VDFAYSTFGGGTSDNNFHVLSLTQSEGSGGVSSRILEGGSVG
jgi:hypothetical protein